MSDWSRPSVSSRQPPHKGQPSAPAHSAAPSDGGRRGLGRAHGLFISNHLTAAGVETPAGCPRGVFWSHTFGFVAESPERPPRAVRWAAPGRGAAQHRSAAPRGRRARPSAQRRRAAPRPPRSERRSPQPQGSLPDTVRPGPGGRRPLPPRPPPPPPEITTTAAAQRPQLNGKHPPCREGRKAAADQHGSRGCTRLRSTGAALVPARGAHLEGPSRRELLQQRRHFPALPSRPSLRPDPAAREHALRHPLRRRRACATADCRPRPPEVAGSSPGAAGVAPRTGLERELLLCAACGPVRPRATRERQALYQLFTCSNPEAVLASCLRVKRQTAQLVVGRELAGGWQRPPPLLQYWTKLRLLGEIFTAEVRAAGTTFTVSNSFLVSAVPEVGLECQPDHRGGLWNRFWR